MSDDNPLQKNDVLEMQIEDYVEAVVHQLGIYTAKLKQINEAKNK